MAYQIAFATFFCEVLYFCGVDNSAQLEVYVNIAFVLSNIWISFRKDIYSLRHFTLFGLAAMICSIFGITLYYFMQANQVKRTQHTIVFVRIDRSFFGSFASSFFCYLCHQFIFPLKNELQKPTLIKMDKIALRSVLIQFSLYA